MHRNLPLPFQTRKTSMMPGATGYKHVCEGRTHLPNHELSEGCTTFHTLSSRIHSKTASASAAAWRLDTVAHLFPWSFPNKVTWACCVSCIITLCTCREVYHAAMLSTTSLNIDWKSSGPPATVFQTTLISVYSYLYFPGLEQNCFTANAVTWLLRTFLKTVLPRYNLRVGHKIHRGKQHFFVLPCITLQRWRTASSS